MVDVEETGEQGGGETDEDHDVPELPVPPPPSANPVTRQPKATKSRSTEPVLSTGPPLPTPGPVATPTTPGRDATLDDRADGTGTGWLGGSVQEHMTVWKPRILRPVSTVIAATLLAAGCGAARVDTGGQAPPPSTTAERSATTGSGAASCAWRRDLPVVTLRLADSEPPPVVPARAHQRVAVVSAYRDNAMRVPVASRPGAACRVTTTRRSGAVTAVYVMRGRGRVTFRSSFRRPSDAMDPLMSGVVRVTGP